MFLVNKCTYIKRIMARFEKILNKISKIAAYIAMVMLAAMMFLTATDVILRYAFNRPIMGVYEISEYLMCILASMAFAYTQIGKGHVSIDIGISRLGPRAQAVIDGITYMLALGIFSIMSWQAYTWAGITERGGLESGVLPINVYPFYYVLLFGLILLSLVILCDLVRFILRAVKK